jgi:hypothetical protein
MGRAGQARVARDFTLEAMAAATTSLYQEVAGTRHASVA